MIRVKCQSSLHVTKWIKITCHIKGNNLCYKYIKYNLYLMQVLLTNRIVGNFRTVHILDPSYTSTDVPLDRGRIPNMQNVE